MKPEECNRFCECPCIADGAAKILDNHGTALIVQMPCGKQWIFKDRLEWFQSGPGATPAAISPSPGMSARR